MAAMPPLGALDIGSPPGLVGIAGKGRGEAKSGITGMLRPPGILCTGETGLAGIGGTLGLRMTGMLIPQQFQARRLLLIREFGFLAVLALVSFFFMPFIRAQKESRREPPSGCGGFSPGLPGLARL